MKMLKLFIYPLYFLVNHLSFRSIFPKKIRRKLDWFRTILIAFLGKKNIGKNVFISKNFFSANYNNLILGNNGTIGINCQFYSYDFISVGNNFLIGSNVVIHTSEHNFCDFDKPIIEQGSKYLPVTIGNNVYIGSGVSILPGIKIGDNVIIGTGSVVTKNPGNNCIFAGNPARKIKEIYND